MRVVGVSLCDLVIHDWKSTPHGQGSTIHPSKDTTQESRSEIVVSTLGYSEACGMLGAKWSYGALSHTHTRPPSFVSFLHIIGV